MLARKPDLSRRAHTLAHAAHILRGFRDRHLEIDITPIAGKVVELPGRVEDAGGHASGRGRGVVREKGDVREEEGEERV